MAHLPPPSASAWELEAASSPDTDQSHYRVTLWYMILSTCVIILVCCHIDSICKFYIVLSYISAHMSAPSANLIMWTASYSHSRFLFICFSICVLHNLKNWSCTVIRTCKTMHNVFNWFIFDVLSWWTVIIIIFIFSASLALHQKHLLALNYMIILKFYLLWSKWSWIF